MCVGKLGQSGRRLAPVLGIALRSVYRAAAREPARAVEWVPCSRKMTEVAASSIYGKAYEAWALGQGKAENIVA